MAAAAVVVLGLLAVPVPAGAAPRVPCGSPPPRSAVSTALPYEAAWYDLDRLAPVTTGFGVRVAVVDSGVDDRHPQLSGHVEPGRDLLHGGLDGRQDCVGHGTGVASVITARAVAGVRFRGLAPASTIVPVRISEQEQIDGRAVGEQGGPGRFAEAIRWAADPAGGDADVINLSLVMTVDDPRVRAAVAQAIGRGVVVVAAAGNGGGADAANPVPYPAAYPQVIGVGAVDAQGVRAQFSQRGEYVDIVAAGAGVTVAAVRSGHTSADGTSFATPFVAATAALIKQRFPDYSPAQVQRRLVATADPAPGGLHSDEYGFGLLNPYRAVTETLGEDLPRAPAPVVRHTGDPALVALAARRERSRDSALLVAAAGVGVVALAGVGAVVVRRGRQRRWRPAGRIRS